MNSTTCVHVTSGLITVGMCGIDFSFQFVSVWFKKRGSVRIFIDIYYSCNSKYYSDSGQHDFDVTHNNDNK